MAEVVDVVPASREVAPENDVPSNEAEVSGWPAPKAHDHEASERIRRRTSCHDVPSAFAARRRRMPSVRASTRLPPSRASTVAVDSFFGANADGPVGAFAICAGVPWASPSQRQPSRPRPTSTQPPPSVVMSQ
ncbi:hypothetical protein ASF37_09950 [Aeromicrobium sp. Leaf289]|uniref:hypothetical protein n=1 Tax=Aeromicrobium sp. Leaf289 TaxID=1736324 RepID=UPI0006F47C74|nr:hypothetical protein [Aeromicrobium sp. Leaf289]KQP78820.1 hypothetical protein ASF37_09950 [Aeromicrobium sp. Leaf289]